MPTGALSSLNRWKGRLRAAFWCALGFPNLVKAREVSARNRKARKQARLLAEANLRNTLRLRRHRAVLITQKITHWHYLRTLNCGIYR